MANLSTLSDVTRGPLAVAPGLRRAATQAILVLALLGALAGLWQTDAFRSFATRSDAETSYRIGKSHFQGGLGAQDFGQARKWFAEAAQMGHPAAAYHLGLMQLNGYGYGTASDTAGALDWLHKAATAGNAEALFLLANTYRYGQGVPRDEAKALDFLLRAVEQEHPAAAQSLALAYRYGELGLAVDEDHYQLHLAEAAHAMKHYVAP
jgi:uncharacterized protein